jgi:hypothetical protein
MKAISDPVLRQQLSDKRNQKDASKENKQPVEVKKYDQAVASVSVKTGADGKPVLNEKGQPVAVVTLADGTKKEVPVTENTTVVGADGKEVAISKDGTMSPADGKPVTPAADVAKTDPAKVGDGNLIVRFKQAGDQKFGRGGGPLRWCGQWTVRWVGKGFGDEIT